MGIVYILFVIGVTILAKRAIRFIKRHIIQILGGW